MGAVGQPLGGRIAPQVADGGQDLVGRAEIELDQALTPNFELEAVHRTVGRPSGGRAYGDHRIRPGPSRFPLRAAAPALTGPDLSELVQWVILYVNWRTLCVWHPRQSD